MARNTVHCDMCGKAFFPNSLPIHVKTCALKMALIPVPCLYCREEHPHGEMAKHHLKCKEAKKQKATQRKLEKESLARSQNHNGGNSINDSNNNLQIQNGQDSSSPNVGDKVELFGLSAKPEMNGLKGKIMESLNQSTGRFVVKLENNDTPFNLKPINLKVISSSSTSQMIDKNNGIGGAGAGGGMMAGGTMNCAICGRGFTIDRISTHQRICEKLTNKAKTQPRKVYPPKRGRIDPEAAAAKRHAGPEPPPPKNRWKQRHLQFQSIIQNAKQYDRENALKKKQNMTLASPSRLRPSSSSSSHSRNNNISHTVDTNGFDDDGDMDDDGFVPCPYCHRTFAPQTAERHIPKCQHTINKPKAPPGLRNTYEKEEEEERMRYEQRIPIHKNKTVRGGGGSRQQNSGGSSSSSRAGGKGDLRTRSSPSLLPQTRASSSQGQRGMNRKPSNNLSNNLSNNNGGGGSGGGSRSRGGSHQQQRKEPNARSSHANLPSVKNSFATTAPPSQFASQSQPSQNKSQHGSYRQLISPHQISAQQTNQPRIPPSQNNLNSNNNNNNNDIDISLSNIDNWIGHRAMICGTGREDINGQCGQCESVVKDRVIVVLDNGRRLGVRANNLVEDIDLTSPYSNPSTSYSTPITSTPTTTTTSTTPPTSTHTTSSSSTSRLKSNLSNAKTIDNNLNTPNKKVEFKDYKDEAIGGGGRGGGGGGDNDDFGETTRLLQSTIDIDSALQSTCNLNSTLQSTWNSTLNTTNDFLPTEKDEDQVAISTASSLSTASGSGLGAIRALSPNSTDQNLVSQLPSY